MTDTSLYERIGKLDAKCDAAHARVDRMETVIREDLKELKVELSALSAWMHQGKGTMAAIVTIAGLLGGILSTVVSHFLK